MNTSLRSLGLNPNPDIPKLTWLGLCSTKSSTRTSMKFQINYNLRHFAAYCLLNKTDVLDNKRGLKADPKCGGWISSLS